MIVSEDLSQKDISFINNVCLNSMRRNIHCKLILNKFIKSKLNTNQRILLSSAIVQIIYLKIKPYAVVNETVNVAKKVKVFSGFVNAVLKNILNNIDKVNKISGMDISFVTSAETDKEAKSLLTELGLPFKKN